MSSVLTTNVLLIEDNLADTTMVRSLMESGESDFTITEVRSVPEATHYLASHTVDVIVLALASDGLVDFEALHHAHPHIPVVVLTGTYPELARDVPEAGLSAAALQGGAQDTLSKSDLTAISMERAISHVAERYRRRRAEGALAKVRGALGSAREVQEHLFPEPPLNSGLEVWGAVLSPDVSGDFYDFLPLSGGRLLIAVGDITGHGFDAALLMATARAYIRATVRMLDAAAEVSELMAILNDLLAHDVGDDRFVALTLAVVDLEAMRLTYSSAGQPPACLLSDTGLGLELASPPNVPLGIDPGRVYGSSTHPLAQGDLLAFMTDGLLEVRGPAGEEFGTGRILGELERNRDLSAEMIVSEMHRTLASFTSSRRHRDDITLVVVKIPRL